MGLRPPGLENDARRARRRLALRPRLRSGRPGRAGVDRGPLLRDRDHEPHPLRSRGDLDAGPDLLSAARLRGELRHQRRRGGSRAGLRQARETGRGFLPHGHGERRECPRLLHAVARLHAHRRLQLVRQRHRAGHAVRDALGREAQLRQPGHDLVGADAGREPARHLGGDLEPEVHRRRGSGSTVASRTSRTSPPTPTWRSSAPRSSPSSTPRSGPRSASPRPWGSR